MLLSDAVLPSVGEQAKFGWTIWLALGQRPLFLTAEIGELAYTIAVIMKTWESLVKVWLALPEH